MTQQEGAYNTTTQRRPSAHNEVESKNSRSPGNARRRRLSVSTVDPLKVSEKPGIFGDSPSHQDAETEPSAEGIDFNVATAAISRDEPLATPKRESPEKTPPEKPRKPSLITDPDKEIKNLHPPSPARRGRRLSVSGRIAPGMNAEIDYQLKEVAIKHSNDFKMETIKDQLVDMGIGYACHKGLKPESPNQDDFFIIRIDDWGLYGVFDGHGPFGHDVSNFVQREFPKQLYSPEFLMAHPNRIGYCMIDGFQKVQKKLEAYCNQPTIRTCCSLSGSTASIVYHRIKEKRLIVAHVGDSRVVIGRKSKKGHQAEDLAKDHKPDNEAERRRIYERGGVVKRIAGDIPHRVFLQGKMFPGLAMSRALGDLVGHKAGVICTPDVLDYKIRPEDDFLILASDGIWEFIDSQECVEKVASYPPSKLAACVEEICEEAWRRWKEEEGNVVDDITLEVIYLNQGDA